ncbi:MAG: biotin synthase BioB [Selenomonas sp.]|uniref:biotin synthase BioB n=1 Tax=Selenomonas sp. TaxID=2053611 RepID=UPI0025F84B43|nr:biotin synthase BioB [Selenomonas sp.]MCR5756814.1 biotin synthase BioB [Selenomonas sp.]
MTSKIHTLTNKIIAGCRLQRSDDLSLLLDTPLGELLEESGRLQKHFCGSHIDLCTILNGRSGRCSENCKYCAQAACHHTGIEEYAFLPSEEIIANARENEKAGVNRFAIVTSGRALGGKEFDQAIATYKQLRDTLHIGLCASHGIISQEQFKRLRAAGVTNYHHNIETSRRFFPQICTSHTYEDRIKTIKIAQEEGLNVCSGGIIGMGETWQDRLDMALSLAELHITSIPINVLTAIKGTGLENQPRLLPDEIMRTIAIFRLINPEANIRLAAGRKLLPDNGAEAFTHGASASITGNMLTTSGTTIKEDLALLAELGLSNQEKAAITLNA